MRSIVSPSTASLALMIAAGCADERVSGNTTQTENTLARIAVDSVLPEWNHPVRATTVATLRFDSSNFDFRLTDSAGRDLSVEKESGQPIPFDIVFWDKPARLGRLQVRLDSSLLHPGSHFLLRWNQTLQVRSSHAAVWQSLPDSQVLALRSVPVADFGTGSDTTQLPTRPLWSYFSMDSSTFIGRQFVPATPRPGTALSIGYSTIGTGYVVVKAPLVLGGAPRNIRAMDSLVFWAKGTKGSSLFLAFDHRNAFKAWKLDTLDTVWTRFRVRPSDFIPASNPIGGNRGWVAVRDSATDLSFILSGGTDAMLDDIRIYGLNREDF